MSKESNLSIEENSPPATRYSRVLDLQMRYSALDPESFKEQLFTANKLQLLEALNDALSMSDTQASCQAIKEVLAKNSERQLSALGYTALAEDKVTELLCDVAAWVAEVTGELALRVLLPGVSTKSISDDYPDLTQEHPQTIFKTHILSQCGQYLLPVRLLLGISLESDGNEKLFNPYYDYKKGGKAELQPQELERLYEHSSVTRALRQAQVDCYRLFKQESLYSQLIALIHALYLNSASVMGVEDNAAGGAYPAIINFNEYYQKLDTEQKLQIPASLKDEIEKLLDLSVNPKRNVNATENMETCLAIRKTKLQQAMQGHQVTLMQISLSAQTKQGVLIEQKEIFLQNRQLLARELQGGSYSGSDSLPLTLEILNQLNISPRVTNMAELNDVMTLCADELVMLLENPRLTNQMIRQLNSIETLVMFLINTNNERLHAVLPKMRGALVRDGCVTTAQDLAACLMPLQGDKLQIVSESWLSEGESPLIKTAWNFEGLFKDLSSEQRKVVFELLKEQLPQLIKNARDFRDVLKNLSPEQRTVVFELFNEQLPQLIKTAEQFLCVLEHLSLEQRTFVFELFKDQLLQFIKRAWDFKCVIRYLSPEQRAVVLDLFKEELPQLIKKVEDLGCVLERLNPKLCLIVCQVLKEQLPQLIITARDFGRVHEYLGFEQCLIVCQAFNEQLPQLIKTVEDFRNVLEDLSSEQCAAVVIVMQSRLGELIGDEAKIREFLNNHDVSLFALKCSDVAVPSGLPTVSFVPGYKNHTDRTSVRDFPRELLANTNLINKALRRP